MIRCILENDKFELALSEKNMTIARALEGTTLHNLSKSLGEKNTLKVLYTLILNTSNYFNVAHGLNNDQALQTATLLMDKYPLETVEDFVMVFKLAKRGEFGTLMHRLDGSVVFEWCAKYFDLKYQKKDELHDRKVKGEKADSKESSKRMGDLFKAASFVVSVKKLKEINQLTQRVDKVIEKYSKKAKN